MTDSENIARQFSHSEAGKRLLNEKRYFRFNVPQGMEDLELDDFKKTERMDALTAEYLHDVWAGENVARCAHALVPVENQSSERTGI